MKCIVLLKDKSQMVIYPNSKSTTGIYVATKPYIFLSKDASSNEIAVSINEALLAYKENIPYSTNFKDEDEEYLKNIGFKNFKDLFSRSILCKVESKGDILTFTPTKNAGVKSGFIAKHNESITIPVSSANEIISATLFEALLRSDE